MTVRAGPTLVASTLQRLHHSCSWAILRKGLSRTVLLKTVSPVETKPSATLPKEHTLLSICQGTLLHPFSLQLEEELYALAVIAEPAAACRLL
jgi:hypothetical protein